MKRSLSLWIALLFLTAFSASVNASEKVFVLTAPYFEISDGISIETLRSFWQGKPQKDIPCLMLSPSTYREFSALWGLPKRDLPAHTAIFVADAAVLLERAWRSGNCRALIPFEELDPRWKVLQIDGTSPFSFSFDPASYALSLPLPKGEASNFDPQKLTSLTMTGTTAIARNLAYHMEEESILLPTEEIGATLAAADLTHISNESSFSPDCPPGTPLRREARFCSAPSYFEVLKASGADIIELTGNHNLDWGYEPFEYSMGLYEKEGLKTFGGGRTEEEALVPLLIEHNGNKLAFIGCNAIGPGNIFATADTPGAARCDVELLKEEVRSLRKQGWLPIVTFQHLEYTWYDVPPLQSHDFYEVAQAAPVIISGSQAHIPQGMTFVDDTFIHFGLGNLYFDQMSEVERTSFFDTHYFYDNRYLGNRLETIILENYSRPRFLTTEEREAFLKLIFDNSPKPDKTFGGRS